MLTQIVGKNFFYMLCNSKAKSLKQVSSVKTISENKIMLIFHSAADSTSEFLEQTG